MKARVIFIGRVGSTLLLVAGTLVIYQWLNTRLAPRFDFSLPVDG